MKLLLKKMADDVELPTKAYPTSVGLDLKAYVKSSDYKSNVIVIGTGQVRAVRTGLLFGGIEGEGPQLGSFFAAVCSRSGLASEGVFVINSPGIIDPEYRGEVTVLLTNMRREPRYIKDGDRIAQLVILPALLPVVAEPKELTKTERGAKGFGSTGK